MHKHIFGSKRLAQFRAMKDGKQNGGFEGRWLSETNPCFLLFFGGRGPTRGDFYMYIYIYIFVFSLFIILCS